MIGWQEKLSGFNHDLPGCEVRGKLEAWSNAANMLFAAGCEPQAFALLCSFAAPLMRLFPTKEGGAVVSIVGGRRSGKSVALTAAASVWGASTAGEKPCVLGAARGADRLRHVPSLLTTLANRDPQVLAGQITEMLVDPQVDDMTILLSFSGEPLNHPLALEFKLAVPRGLIEPTKERPSPLEVALLTNRGHAGPAFIAELVTPSRLVWAKKHLTSKVATIIEETGAGGAHRFQTRAIAAVWVAGLICAELGLLEFSPERIARWAIDKGLPKRAARP